MSATASYGEVSQEVVSKVTPSFDDSRLSQKMLTDGVDKCFISSMKFGAVDNCTYIVAGVTVPMVCLRFYNNSPMAFAEGSAKGGHIVIAPQSAENSMKEINANQSPAEKNLGQRAGDMSASAITAQGHAVNIPIASMAFKLAVSSVGSTFVCSPAFDVTRAPYGYSFASEGDHMNGTSYGNWRGVVSAYWFVPWLTPLTAVSLAMTSAGAGPIDYYRIFAHGAWGTVYPAAGKMIGNSPQVAVAEAAWDAIAVPAAPFGTYGPLHLRLGFAVVSLAHNARAYQMGMTSMFATAQRGIYVQPFRPTADFSGGCFSTVNPAADVLLREVWIPQIDSEHLTESAQAEAVTPDRVVAAGVWPRFTCCNTCIGSSQTAYRHMRVGKGFLPQQVIKD